MEHDIMGGKAKVKIEYGDMQEELNKVVIALKEVSFLLKTSGLVFTRRRRRSMQRIATRPP